MRKSPTFMLAILIGLTLCSIAIADNDCVSNSPVSSKLYMLNKEIKKQDLGNFNVTENLQIKVDFYNKCEKKITNIDFSTEKIEITFVPDFKVRDLVIYPHIKFLQENGEFIIDLNTTLVGKYKLNGKYFPLETYYITFIPGKASSKSILEVDKTVITAGETLTVYIIPYDKYENLIDANKYINSNTPFNVTYNYFGSSDEIYAQNPRITYILNNPIISYENKFTQVGEVIIAGRVGENLLNNRTVIVKPAGINFDQSKIYRYIKESNVLELIKNKDVEKTNKVEPVYRLYFEDKYGNVIKSIPEEKLKNFKSYLNFTKISYIFYNFKLNNDKYIDQQYVEFIIDDENNKIPYKSLLSGNYGLVFTDGSEKLSYNIVLKNGCDSDKPFKCSISGKMKCVRSQTDCDCPKGYFKCGFMHYCVPDNKISEMCPDVLTTQRVCSFGKVLCGDLSCRDEYKECPIFDSCEFEEIKCPDQTCKTNLKDCPNFINCKSPKNYVCNNGKCVESELECDYD